MKNLLICLAVLLAATACVKQEHNDSPSDKWNGYSRYLKMGEQVHTLWAGRHIDAGTVTYGIDDSANFYVTYNCNGTIWLITESHMFAGDKADMPLNKPGAPKIGLFPHSGQHNPAVSCITYKVPLAQLPPCEAPGFVVASHCVVRNYSGQVETAWAEGDYTFSDKGWGWYDDFYFNQNYYDPYTIIYGTAYSNDSLKLFHLDITRGTVDLIMTEYVGSAPGNFNAVGFDTESGALIFSNYDNGALYVNLINSEGPSICAGYLGGIAASGTMHDQMYYYVDENLHTINRINFTSDWMIAGETILDTISGFGTINDIAMDPGGDFLYLMSQYNINEGNELMSWDVENHVFFSSPVVINNGAQLAFGSDGILYAIAPQYENGCTSWIYVVDIKCVTLTVVEDEIIFIDDPFTDLASGPLM